MMRAIRRAFLALRVARFAATALALLAEGAAVTLVVATVLAALAPLAPFLKLALSVSAGKGGAKKDQSRS